MSGIAARVVRASDVARCSHIGHICRILSGKTACILRSRDSPFANDVADGARCDTYKTTRLLLARHIAMMAKPPEMESVAVTVPVW